MANTKVIPCEHCGRDAQINAFVFGSTEFQHRVIRVAHICATCYESEEHWWEGVPEEDRIPSISMYRGLDA